MPPKAKFQCTKKRIDLKNSKQPKWVQHSNERKRAREEAVKSLNDMAVDFGLQKVPVKSTWLRVQQLIRKVQACGLDSSAAARLHGAAEQWIVNGGRLQGTLVPLPLVNAAQTAAEPPAVPRHRVLEASFRIQSHAFMLTYNSAAFTPETWLELKKCE